MTIYSEFVEGLFKEMGSESATAMHAAAGASGEAGELLDAVKKFWVYNKPLDLDNVKEELGDMCFYMQKLMNMYGWTWQDVMDANVAKLAKRYPTGKYSDAQAQARADKQEDALRNLASDIVDGSLS